MSRIKNKSKFLNVVIAVLLVLTIFSNQSHAEAIFTLKDGTLKTRLFDVTKVIKAEKPAETPGVIEVTASVNSKVILNRRPVIFNAFKLNFNKSKNDYDLGDKVFAVGKAQLFESDFPEVNLEDIDQNSIELIYYDVGNYIEFKEPGLYLVEYTEEAVGAEYIYLEVVDNTVNKKNQNKNILAQKSNSKFLLNSKNVSLDAYKIKDNNYFKLRDLATILDKTNKEFDVSWNPNTSSIELLSNQSYTSVGGELEKKDNKDKQAVLNKSIIYKDGEKISLDAYTIDGNNYFKLRDIGILFDFEVAWDQNLKTIIVNTNNPYNENL